jgi:wyosine [tRNA(Phe)-imidazoG37] synthetase (radical SAM superfamily)
MKHEKNHIFGPVPSRRLGLSLGVDVVPFKVCTLDCVYCQVGHTTDKTLERREYVPIDTLLEELRDKLSQGIEPDYITLSGSGEPTLNARLGDLIDGIRQLTPIPVALITNATLLYQAAVRSDCCKADLILPSLDAAWDASLALINCPHPDICVHSIISGLEALRQAFSGQIWLEIFLIEGLNTSEDNLKKIGQAIERIRPDKVQLNTAVRPTAQIGIPRMTADKMERIAQHIGHDCEVIASFSHSPSAPMDRGSQDVMTMLKRRPCSLTDVCTSLGMDQKKALHELSSLLSQGQIQSEDRSGVLFYLASEGGQQHRQ